MPHALVIAAAVTAGVGAAIAFEVNVFKPWREEHWTEGWAEGIKQEWDEFAENVRENFNDITGEHRQHRGFPFSGSSHHQQGQRRGGRRNSDQQEEMELRREMDDFSVHEAQTSGIKARFADEFDQAQGGVRLRKGKDALIGSTMEDTLLNGPTLGYQPSSSSFHDDNATFRDTKGQSSLYQTSFIHNTATPTAVDTDHQQHSPIVAVVSSQSPHGDADLGWHSPRSVAQTEEASTISADWQRHFSPRSTPPRTATDSENGESETWTQLNDSRSASPLSPSWSETELSQADR